MEIQIPTQFLCSIRIKYVTSAFKHFSSLSMFLSFPHRSQAFNFASSARACALDIFSRSSKKKLFVGSSGWPGGVMPCFFLKSFEKFKLDGVTNFYVYLTCFRECSFPWADDFSSRYWDNIRRKDHHIYRCNILHDNCSNLLRCFEGKDLFSHCGRLTYK